MVPSAEAERADCEPSPSLLASPSLTRALFVRPDLADSDRKDRSSHLKFSWNRSCSFVCKLALRADSCLTHLVKVSFSRASSDMLPSSRMLACPTSCLLSNLPRVPSVYSIASSIRPLTIWFLPCYNFSLCSSCDCLILSWAWLRVFCSKLKVGFFRSSHSEPSMRYSVAKFSY